MDPRTERFAVTVFLIVLLVGSFVFYDLLTYKSSTIKKATQYLKEYKTAKAIEVLAEAQKRTHGKDKDLNVVVLYSLIRSSKFSEAEKFLEKDVEYLPKEFKKNFYELIEILELNDRSKLIIMLINKAQRLKLEEDFFINTSKRRETPYEEFQILEAGLNYYRAAKSKEKKDDDEPKVFGNKLQDYVLKRCIDVAGNYLGSKNPREALKYLEKAETLKLLKNSSRKDDYYYTLALTQKNLGNIDKARDYMELAAKLGNKDAKEIIKQNSPDNESEEEDTKDEQKPL